MDVPKLLEIVFDIIFIPIYIWILISVLRVIKNMVTRKRRRRRRVSAPVRRTVPNTEFHAPDNTSNHAPDTVPAQPFAPPRTPADTQTSNERNRTGYQGSETGEMIYYATDDHGLAEKEYRFNFKKVNGEWRAYIVKMPSYGSRETWGHVTHRHFDGDKPYICWDKKITELKDMQAVAKVWSNMTQKYIATGQRFG